MQIKKWIATGLTALMTGVTLAAPILAATNLGSFPSNIATKTDTLSTLNAFVVIGDNAAAADVVGAVDLGMALATVSYEQKTSAGTTTTLTGLERKILIPSTATGGVIGGTTSNNLPASLQTFHFSGLKESQYEYKSTKHNYKEVVELGTSTPQMTHKLGDPVNGTLKMKIDTGSIVYKYRFTDSIAATDFNQSTTTDYDNPVEVSVAGHTFQIGAVPSTASFKALSQPGVWVTAGSTTGATVDSLTALVDAVYSGTQASVRIVDANGNLVTNLGVVGTTAKSFTSGGTTYNVKVVSTATSSKEGVSDSAKIAIAKGDIEKTFDGSDTATITDWGSSWKISGQFAAAGRIQNNDNITVTYSPASLAEADKYYISGGTFKGPSGYFELSYAGLDPNKFAQITFSPVTGKTVYNSTAASGYSTVTSLNGLEISGDVSGSIGSGSNYYDKMYVLFNATPRASTMNDTNIWIGYWDKSTSRIVNLDTATYPLAINNTNSATQSGIINDRTLTLSYGGTGSAPAPYNLNISLSESSLIGTVFVYNSTGIVKQVEANFGNRSVSTASSTPELIIGTATGAVQSSDIVAYVESSQQDISSQLKDVITDGGVQAYSVKSNAESEKMVVGIPPEQIYAKVQFGKTGGTTTAGDKFNVVVGVTDAVAKLAKEVASSDKTNKNLVLVGGPCANSLVQELVDNTKLNLDSYNSTDFTCTGKVGSAWAADTGYVMLVNDAFTTGKVAIIAAGTNADQTRMATSVLQKYSTYATNLANKTIVKFTGTAISNIKFA